MDRGDAAEKLIRRVPLRKLIQPPAKIVQFVAQCEQFSDPLGQIIQFSIDFACQSTAVVPRAIAGCHRHFGFDTVSSSHAHCIAILVEGQLAIEKIGPAQ
jgi:hypothetical protein